jgi:hypothetical protein
MNPDTLPIFGAPGKLETLTPFLPNRRRERPIAVVAE